MSGGPGHCRLAAAWAPFFIQRLKAVYPPSHVSLFRTLPEYALEFCPHLTDPREIARHRVAELYRLLPMVPVQARHAVGWWIDTHMPVILSDVSTVCAMYRKGLAPELNYTFPPSATTSIIKQLWMPSVGARLDASEVACLKLLRKASVSPPSIRYISTQLTRCANLPGEAQRVSRSLILMHLLGLYPGRKVIMPPEERLGLYRKTTPELAVHLSACTSRDMYSIVATYLVWATRSELALWQFCYRMYPQYMMQIMNSGLESNAKVFIECEGMSPAWRRPSTFAVFLEALEVKKKLPAWVQTGIGGVDTMERCIKVGSMVERLSTAALEAAGISPASAAKFVCCTRSRARALAVLDTVDITERARLYVVLMARETRSTVRIGRLADHMTAVQKVARDRVHGPNVDLYTCVCLACGTWRPKSRGLTGLSKATGGIIVNYSDSKLTCCACLADWSVVMVPLVGHLIRARLRLTAEPVAIAMCMGCAQVSHPLYPIGAGLYCGKCKATSAKFMGVRPECAVCKAPVTATAGNTITVAGSGSPVLVALCSRHSYVARRATSDTTLSQLASMGTRSKQSGFYKPSGGIRLNHGRKL